MTGIEQKTKAIEHNSKRACLSVDKHYPSAWTIEIVTYNTQYKIKPCALRTQINLGQEDEGETGSKGCTAWKSSKQLSLNKREPLSQFELKAFSPPQY